MMLELLGEAGGIITLWDPYDNEREYLVFEFHNHIGRYSFKQSRAVVVAFAKGKYGLFVGEGVGMSVCSVLDCYNRDRGFQIATGRAKKKLLTGRLFQHERKEDGTFVTDRSLTAEKLALEYVREIDRRAREKAKKKHVTVRLRFGNNTLKWPNNIKWREEPVW